MNKTFKIVFNKARGALMVANEITSTAMKKNISVTILAILASITPISTCLAEVSPELPTIGVNGKNKTVTGSGEYHYIRSTNRGGKIIAGTTGDTITITKHMEDRGKYGINNSGEAGIVANNPWTKFTKDRQASVTINASTLKIDVTGTTDTVTINNTKITGFSYGIYAKTSTAIPDGNPYASRVILNSDDTTIVARSEKKLGADGITQAMAVGIAAISNGEVFANSGNISIDAEDIILSRGYAKVELNQNDAYTVKLNGNVDFNFDAKTSGTTVDSTVKINLSNSDSYWVGRSYATNDAIGEIAMPSDNPYFQVGEKTPGFVLGISNGATWTMTGNSFVNSLRLKDGGIIATGAENAILNANKITISGDNNEFFANSTAKIVGEISFVGENASMSTSLNTAFETTASDGVVTDANGLLNIASADVGASLIITDKFAYSASGLTALSNAYSTIDNLSLVLKNASLYTDADAKDIAIPKNTSVEVAATGDIGNGAEKISIDTQGGLTVFGKTLGKAEATASVIDIASDGTLSVIENASLTVDTLSGAGQVNIGKINGRGASLSIKNLTMDGGSIFVDPAYDHATLQVDALGDTNTLNTQITAGNGAFVAIGTNTASAKAAVAKLNGFDSVKSVFYVGTPITLGTNGGIEVNPSAISTQSGASASVSVAADAGLVIDQTAIGSETALNGASLTLANGSYIGLTNVTGGIVTLADSVQNLGATVALDTPFFTGAVQNDGTVVIEVSAENGLGALASTGIQAMTRRADTILAQTIADRTSVDQELAAGTNLWVDVTGEHYEADKLDNGGEFKSDMGYGTFGADFAVAQDITAGAAFQYGKGSLRSGVSSIKNSIDSYGVTAYGAMKFGDAKIVAEASYIKNENDITSSQTALNQSVDSEIYSVGVRGQHRFTAGNFQFVPSVGVRVSRLNTDAMQVGAVNIKKQEQTLVQVPIALRVNGFEQNVSGWSVAPSFKMAYVPTFGDKEISVLGADQTVIDTSPVQGDFGIRAQNSNLMVNANMMLGGGKDGTSSVGGKVGLKYVF